MKTEMRCKVGLHRWITAGWVPIDSFYSGGLSVREHGTRQKKKDCLSCNTTVTKTVRPRTIDANAIVTRFKMNEENNATQG